MKSSRVFFLVVATVSLFQVAAARAARVDMNDPRRAVGREDDVRIDAELTQETVASGSPVAITYQVENLSNDPIAIAEKECDVSFDADDQAVVVSIGLDVPKNGVMPKLVVLAPNEKKTFTAGGVVRVTVRADGNPFVAVPRYVQIKVNILRGLNLFRQLIERQTRATAPVALNDAQFEQWLENNDTILLNEIPVGYSATAKDALTDASQRGSARSTGGD
jgi:hypothetical protein